MDDDAEVTKLLKTIVLQLKGLNLAMRASLIAPENIFSFVVDDTEIKFYLPHSTVDRIQSMILEGSSFYEGALLRKVARYIEPGAVVVDAGANIGNHTVFFAKLCGARVYAFEPQREVFKMLSHNIALNNINGRVTAFNAALGEHEGRSYLSAHSQRNMAASQFEYGDGQYEVKTIDSLNLDRLDFLKIDVEGAQLSVLAGAAATIQRLRPKVMMELRSKMNEVLQGQTYMEALDYIYEQLDANNYLFSPREA